MRPDEGERQRLVRVRPQRLGGQSQGAAVESRLELCAGDLNVKRMKQFHGGKDTFVPLDSVGGTMLYVNVDVHRQGVLFPVHHLIGSEWSSEGYDGIETEGLCYVAHFLGFKCWGCPTTSSTTSNSEVNPNNACILWFIGV